MRTKASRRRPFQGPACGQNLSVLSITGATEEGAAPERRQGCAPIPGARGPSPPVSGGRRRCRVDQALGRALLRPARPLGACSPLPSAHTLVPSPPGVSRAWEDPRLLPSPVPLPAPSECIFLFPATPPGSVGTTRIYFPCPHPPRPRQLPLAPAEVTGLRPRLRGRGAVSGPPSSSKLLPVLAFATGPPALCCPSLGFLGGPPAMPSLPVPRGWGSSLSSCHALTFDSLRWVCLRVNYVSQRGASWLQPGGFSVTSSGPRALQMS